MSVSQEFRGDPAHVVEARRWADSHMSGSPHAADVALVVTELASNAVRHTRSGDADGFFTVRLSVDVEKVRIEVADMGSDTEPRVKPVTFDIDGDEFELPETGRGLSLVESLAARWGVEGDTTGRVVWAEID